MKALSPILIGLLMLGAAVGLLMIHTERPPYAAGSVVYAEAIQYWLPKLDRSPSRKTYEEFVDGAKDMLPSDQHLLAHAFGEATYRTLGTDGIALCGDEYLYGCFHQVAGLSMHDSGLSALAELRKACGTGADAEPCNHGIGHGLIGYLGYGESSLFDALDKCEDLQSGTRYIACSEGVFMEYNRRFMADGAPGQVRPLEDGLYSPCGSFSGDRALLCVFWLPNWWYFAQAHPTLDEQTIVRFGAQCATLGGNLRSACESGIGYMAAIHNSLDSERAMKACRLFTEKASALSCVRGVEKRLDGAFRVPLD